LAAADPPKIKSAARLRPRQQAQATTPFQISSDLYCEKLTPAYLQVVANATTCGKSKIIHAGA
jgi:hypothetical protein